MNVITTKRLHLRKFVTEDAPFILEMLNTPGWLKYIGDRGVKTIVDAQTYISENIMKSYSAFGFGLYLVVLKNRKTPIGMCGLIRRQELGDVDIGFALLPQYEGKGYAYEAALHTLDYARKRLQIRRIVAITMEGNSHSIRLLEKLGMRFCKMIQYGKEDLMLFEV